MDFRIKKRTNFRVEESCCIPILKSFFFLAIARLPHLVFQLPIGRKKVNVRVGMQRHSSILESVFFAIQTPR